MLGVTPSCLNILSRYISTMKYSPMGFGTDSEMHVQEDDFCLIMLIEIWADSVQCLLHRQKQHNGMTAKPQPKHLLPIGVGKLYRFGGVR